MSELVCQACGAPLDPAKIDRQLGVIRCEYCRAVTDVARATAPAGAPPAARPEVPLPQKFQVEHPGGAGLRVHWRWFSPAAIVLLFFCCAWDGFLVFWYTGATAGHAPLVFKIFPIAHVAIGLGLTYSCLCMFVNHTVVDASRGFLRVTNGPLPMRANRDLPAATLRQLFSKEKVRTTTDSDGDRRTTRTYELCAITREGRTVSLLTGLESAEQALWLEQHLEGLLGIVDAPVEGEISRSA